MNHIKLFEQFTTKKHLIIVDVQKSFRKFISENYINSLINYSKDFENVYYIYDTHKSTENELYDFFNIKHTIPKKYNYDVNVDFYKEILDDDLYNYIKNKETNNKLIEGDYFKTENGIIVYIGNKHKWFHCENELYQLLKSLKNETVYLVGGSDGECLLDIETTAISLNINIRKNFKYIFSAKHNPIK